MGKVLIITGADFSKNKIENINVIGGMVCFYDEGYNFLSYNNEMKKIDKAEGGVTKGWFNFIKPTGTKYIKMCWQSDLANPLAITTPTVYFR